MSISKTRLHMNGRLASKRGAVTIAADAKIKAEHLRNLGVNLDGVAFDSGLTGGGSGGVPGYVSREALETWLPGTLRAITTVRNIDEIVGITTIGDWRDEAIKLRVIETAGQAALYGDNADIPLADIRTSIEKRGIIAFEQGFRTGQMEEYRLGQSGYQAAEEKRRAASESLDIARNSIGFRGFMSAGTSVYGLLNDPNLSAYQSYSDVGAGGTAWNAGVTFAKLVTDFGRMIDRIESQMGGHLQDNTQLCFVVPTGYRNVLQTREANTGVSFKAWLAETYPNIRIVTSPEFVGANGGADVAYLIAESVAEYDDSDVNGATVIQAVPERYSVIGSENQVKGYLEDAIMATAGVFVVRPWAISRYTISA